MFSLENIGDLLPVLRPRIEKYRRENLEILQQDVANLQEKVGDLAEKPKSKITLADILDSQIDFDMLVTRYWKHFEKFGYPTDELLGKKAMKHSIYLCVDELKSINSKLSKIYSLDDLSTDNPIFKQLLVGVTINGNIGNYSIPSSESMAKLKKSLLIDVLSKSYALIVDGVDVTGTDYTYMLQRSDIYEESPDPQYIGLIKSLLKMMENHVVYASYDVVYPNISAGEKVYTKLPEESSE